MKTVDPAKLNLAEISKICADENSARDLMESILWPNGPVCPHCKSTRAYKLNRSVGSTTRQGVHKCAECRKQFTVTVGTIFADSHIPLSKWLMAIFLLCSAKKSISAHQLHRSLGIAYKSAWFMAHRLRYAMASDSFAKMTGVVEVDETYVDSGGKQGRTKRGRPGPDSGKTPVVSIVQRDGKKRSMVMERVTSANLLSALNEHVIAGATVMTDAYPAYRKYSKTFTHHIVNHSAGEYARKEGELTAHTNTVESSFSLLKRGIIGAFHHVSKKHLGRYVAEFDFRWNHRKDSDGERTLAGLERCIGRRLQYAPLTAKA